MKIKTPHGSIKLGVFPVSIPTKQIQKKSESKKVEQEINQSPTKKEEYPKNYSWSRSIDYTKGIKLKNWNPFKTL